MKIMMFHAYSSSLEQAARMSSLFYTPNVSHFIQSRIQNPCHSLEGPPQSSLLLCTLPHPSSLSFSHTGLFTVTEKCQTCSFFRATISTVLFAYYVLTQITIGLTPLSHSSFSSKNNLSEFPLILGIR